jgi:hypothetical protein
MRAPPVEIGGGRVLHFAVVDSEVRPTGGTRHSVGQIVAGELVPGSPMPPFAALAIVTYADDAGYYLLYLDDDWNEVTDTWHETLEHAISQAEFEYAGVGVKWVDRA